MLQLIQVLYSIRHKAHTLWTLVMAEWDFPSCSESSSWTAVREGQGFRHLTIAARGVTMMGSFADLLRVRYEKPGKTSVVPKPVSVPADAVPLHTFSSSEVLRYVGEVSDPCPAHQEGSVVPPLLLLKTLLSQQPIHSGQIRFYAPIPVDTPVLLARKGNSLVGYAGAVNVFDLNVN